MPSDQDLLLSEFETVRNYFNQHDFTEESWAQTMHGLLDEHVTMKRLDDPGFHMGRSEIKQYFVNGNGQSDHARVTYREPKNCYIIDNVAFISGLADFVAKDGTKHNPASDPRVIAYSFTYLKANGCWKAIHLWGAYVA